MPSASLFKGQKEGGSNTLSKAISAIRSVAEGLFRSSHPSLAAAMLQIVDQASNAFDTASRNMDAIDKDASSLFGRNSLVRLH